ncbi:NAD(P)-dependent oxidoreductase [Dactylosporangium matsuzakiense]|uniref:D-isomer specific 2-hydroxyacid dehydrogenase catalytic domain-containing protein n=1 Tax=Dactylosporangium matsuzakiense TaxID=53360 RepID=A0A9W6NS46_9ACTN|nr:NAD(P)-dependent oxidoreductase [Dactylosporangium matsuzakiense]GLL07244.1 hypothetical protein GCM10017581_089960 [Dactylosporangium matsuzakiense]
MHSEPPAGNSRLPHSAQLAVRTGASTGDGNLQAAIDLRSNHRFWAFTDRHRSLLAARFPAVSLVEIADASHAAQVLRTAEVYFGWRFQPAWFPLASGLRWIASPAAGVDHLPLREATERGVMVTRSFGFHGTPMAEHVMGLVLGFARGLFACAARQRTDLWWQAEIASNFFDVSGSTMTIVGCGSVGQDVARLAMSSIIAIGPTARRYTESGRQRCPQRPN